MAELNVTLLKIGIEKHKMCAQIEVIEQPNQVREKKEQKKLCAKRPQSIKSISNLIQMDLTGDDCSRNKMNYVCKKMGKKVERVNVTSSKKKREVTLCVCLRRVVDTHGR